MSGVAAVRYLLAQATAVTSVVPAVRIFGGVIPLSTTLPAISVLQVSGEERLTVKMAETSPLRTERVQVTVDVPDSSGYPILKELMDRVRAAVVRGAGVVNGVHLDGILPDGQGPDIFDADTGVFSQSRDFLVRYHV